jgi:phosphomannomutase
MQDLAKETSATNKKPSAFNKKLQLSDKEPSASYRKTPATNASSIEASASKIVGYEANGGFMVGSDIELNGKTLHALPTRDAVLPILIVLSLAHQSGAPISGLLKNLPSRFTASACIKDVLKRVSDKITNSLEFDPIKKDEFLFEIYADKAVKINTINKTDGLRLIISNKDVIHIRPSGNAPELRVYIETSTMDKSEELVGLVIKALKKFYI